MVFVSYHLLTFKFLLQKRYSLNNTILHKKTVDLFCLRSSSSGDLNIQESLGGHRPFSRQILLSIRIIIIIIK